MSYINIEYKDNIVGIMSTQASYIQCGETSYCDAETKAHIFLYITPLKKHYQF